MNSPLWINFPLTNQLNRKLRETGAFLFSERFENIENKCPGFQKNTIENVKKEKQDPFKIHDPIAPLFKIKKLEGCNVKQDWAAKHNRILLF